MNMLIAVAAGGALGALTRYGLSLAIHSVVGRGFPWGTFAANALGCLAIGYLYVQLVERSAAPAELRGFLLVGVLGAFTTFSTFSVETLNLIEQRELVAATGNIFGTLAICLLGTWLGMAIGRQ